VLKTRLLILGVLLVAGVVAWQFARTTRSSATSVFHAETSNGPAEEAYFNAAQAALDQWLTSEGYQPAVPCPNPAFGVHGNSETSQAYVASKGAIEPVTLVVTRPIKTRSGLKGTLLWEFSGFTWASEDHQALALNEVHRINTWWNSYLQKNPRP
jgi:hypothetical protein